MRSLMIAATGILAMSITLPAHGAPKSDSRLPFSDPSIANYITRSAAKPISTTRTIPYWHGQYTDPVNGVTYGYNMVGADPAKHLDTTVAIDLIPVNFVFAGNGDFELDGSDVVARTLASPIFHTNDYLSTPSVTSAPDASGSITMVPGGPLSAGNRNVQYEDAVMRSQFNSIGTNYHLRLGTPTVWPAQTIKVPANQGSALQSTRGVAYGTITNIWGGQQLDGAISKLHIDPSHLAILVTNNVFVLLGTRCCIIGWHGATLSLGLGNSGGQGYQPINTYAYFAYTAPATYDPNTHPYLKDVDALSHEIAEWADDPFALNLVNPAATPTVTGYGCLDALEVGDPVTHVGFTMPGNTYDTGPYADGSWSLEDEVFAPWFERQAPNTTSQPTQSPSVYGGRYTFMGDLNPVSDFHRPAATC